MVIVVDRRKKKKEKKAGEGGTWNILIHLLFE